MLGFILAIAVLLTGSFDWIPQATTGNGAYDEFIRLPIDARAKQFGTFEPETKALVKRTHAQRWLDEHRTSLSREQIGIVEEAIRFVTPEIYAKPERPEIRKREEAIINKLRCSLGRKNAMAAFVFDAPAANAPASWRSRVDEWLSWFSECAV